MSIEWTRWSDGETPMHTNSTENVYREDKLEIDSSLYTTDNAVRNPSTQSLMNYDNASDAQHRTRGGGGGEEEEKNRFFSPFVFSSLSLAFLLPCSLRDPNELQKACRSSAGRRSAMLSFATNVHIEKMLTKYIEILVHRLHR